MKETGILFKAEMVRALLRELDPKTQTRRIIDSQPPPDATHAGVIISPGESDGLWSWCNGDPRDIDSVGVCDAPDFRCRFGVPGDRLWSRETAKLQSVGSDWCALSFAADPAMTSPRDIKRPAGVGDCLADHAPYKATSWTSGIFMPRWASRIVLEITDVRVQRLQEISEEDAKAEGVGPAHGPGTTAECSYIASYAALWDSINAKPKPLYAFGKIASYVSYPWEDVNEEREHRGKPWRVVGNPYVFAISFRRI